MPCSAPRVPMPPTVVPAAAGAGGFERLSSSKSSAVPCPCLMHYAVLCCGPVLCHCRRCRRCQPQPRLALVAENGFFLRLTPPGSGSGGQQQPQQHGQQGGWEALLPHADFGWKKTAMPILQQYQVRWRGGGGPSPGICVRLREGVWFRWA